MFLFVLLFGLSEQLVQIYHPGFGSMSALCSEEQSFVYVVLVFITIFVFLIVIRHLCRQCIELIDSLLISVISFLIFYEAHFGLVSSIGCLFHDRLVVILQVEWQKVLFHLDLEHILDKVSL